MTLMLIEKQYPLDEVVFYNTGMEFQALYDTRDKMLPILEANGIALYSILDRVSCFCCGNKNLKELYNIYLYLPQYWGKLKDLQSKTNRPYRRQSGKTLFDLEKEFIQKQSKSQVEFINQR